MPRATAMEAQIHQKLRKLGVSGPGRDWLLRALHPASEHKSPGLPDQSAAPVLRPDYRMNYTISAPPDMASWDCFIWTPPGDVNALYYAIGPAGTDFTAHLAPPDAVYGVINLQSSVLTDAASPYYVQFQNSVQALTSLNEMRVRAFRHQYKSITIEQISAAVSDQGQVYAAQYAPVITRSGEVLPAGFDTGVPIPGSNPPANFRYIGAHYRTVLPASETQLAATAPSFFQGPSREGVYLPLRLSGPTQPFACSLVTGWVHATDAGAGYLSSDDSGAPVGAYLTPISNEPLIGTPVNSQVPWVFDIPVASQNAGHTQLPLPSQMDTGYDNTNIGVIIFRGLNGSGGGFATSLQIKVIAGLEIIPNPRAPDRIFAEEPAPYEPKALEAYYGLCLELKDAYPARFNSLEAIWDAIKDAASKVWDNVEPKLVDAASGLAGGLLSMGSQAVQARLGRAMPMGQRVLYRAPSAARSSSVRSVRVRTPAPKPLGRRARRALVKG